MAAPTIDELTAGINRLSGDMQKSRENAEGMVDQFYNLLKTLIPIGAAVKGLSTLMGGVGAQYAFAARSLVTSGREIQQQRVAETARLAQMRAQVVTGEISLRQYRDARFVHAATRDVFNAQARLALEIEQAGRRTLGVAALLLGAAVKTYDTAVQYNEALLEANSTFGRRLELMLAMGRVQTATGTAQANLINGTRALVRYGLENKTTFEANLKTVVMLHDAIGMSTDEAAHLAAVTENYAKASFQEVADVVATIVDQTALAAAEVKNLGVELTRTLGLVKPGPVTNLPQIIQALSGYEAALKEVGGSVGDFQKLVTNLATPEGIMQAGLLGVTPEMIATGQGIDQIMGRFESLVDRVVGNSEGLNRVWRLDMVAKMMNLSSREVSDMVRALELKRGVDIKELTLQELYARQVDNLNQGVTRLLNSLSALLQQGLYPFVRALSWVVNTLATVIQKLADWRGAVYVAFGVVAVAGVVLVNRLRAATRAFIELAWAAQIATERLRANAMAQLASRGAGVGVPGGAAGRGIGWLSTAIMALDSKLAYAGGYLNVLGRTLQSFWMLFRTGAIGFWSMVGQGIRFLATLLVPVSVGVTAIAAGFAYIGYLLYRIHQVNKRSAEETERVNRALSQRSQTLEQSRREQMYLRMRYGDSEGAMKNLQLWMQESALRMRQMEGKTPEQIKEGLDAILAQGREDLNRAVYTRTIMSPEFNEGKADLTKYDKEMRDAMDRAAKAAEKTQKNTEEGVKQDKASAQHMEEAYDSYWLRIQRFFSSFPPADPMAGSWGNWPAARKQ